VANSHIEQERDGVEIRLDALEHYGRFLITDSAVRTRLTYAQRVPRMTGWVVVTVEADATSETDGLFAPAFVPAYLRTGHVTDGKFHLPHTAEEIDEGGVHYLLPKLEDGRRRVPYVLVSVDAKAPSEARERAEHLAAAAAGAAVVGWFADQRAQDGFNAAVGEDLAVFGGGIRTYLPGLAPRGESHPFRHPVMGGQTLRGLGVRALDTLAGHVVGVTAHHRLPDDVRQAYRVVGRVLNGQEPPEAIAEAAKPTVTPAASPRDLSRETLRQALMAKTVPAPQAAPALAASEPEPTPDPEPEPALDPPTATEIQPATAFPNIEELAQAVARKVVAELQGELIAALELASSAGGTPEGERSELTNQMAVLSTRLRTLGQDLDLARADQRRANTQREEAESESDRLESELEHIRQENEYLELELSESVAKERVLAERARKLESRLAGASQPAIETDQPDPPFEPVSLVEVLLKAEKALSHLVIGDTLETADRLDRASAGATRVWAAKAWDALLALEDYAASAGTFNGGFYEWCQASAGRRVVPTGMFSSKESSVVEGRDKFSEPRTFPVPAEVNSSGRQYMPAHIKLRRVGSPAPRIHFHDDSRGRTGKIWIGYLGDHLPNTRTN
jgi:hypothetical protein